MLAKTPATTAPARLLRSDVASNSPAKGRALWSRHGGTGDNQKAVQALSWALSLSLSSLLIGIIGLLSPINDQVNLLVSASAAENHDSGEVAMLEMTAPPAAEASDSSETDPVLDTSLAESVPLPDLNPPPLDLPELAVLLTSDDVFEIPAAAPVEAMLAPEEPRKTAPSSPSSIASRSPTTAPRSPAASAGSSGGTGANAGGSGTGYFPSPPYPATARSRGMQGTVYLSITFGSDGRVTTTTISRSSGYSDLDRSASDWVRRHWKAPAGQTGTFRQPVHFRLR